MPIYEFKCTKCAFKFEELLPFDHKNPNCIKCGSKSKQLISKFFGVVVGSENRSLDSVIGEQSNKRWEIINKRREKRLKNNKEKSK